MMTPSRRNNNEHDSKQFEEDAPSVLDGVMKRWVVPHEDEEQREPIILQLNLPVEDAEDIEVIPSVPKPPEPLRQSSNGYGWALLFFFGFFIMLILNLYMLIHNRGGQ